jgi:hypothetical protein
MARSARWCPVSGHGADAEAARALRPAAGQAPRHRSMKTSSAGTWFFYGEADCNNQKCLRRSAIILLPWLAERSRPRAPKGPSTAWSYG